MGFFDQILNAKNSNDLAGIQYQEPSIWDRLIASKFGGHLPSLDQFEQIKQSRLGQFQAQEAAPVAKMLARFTAEGNDADPNFTGAEWVKGMATTPALGGEMTEAEYDAARSGAVPGFKKGAVPLTQFSANPVSAKMLQDAELAAQNKGTMARVFNRDGSALDKATVAMDKGMSGGLDNATQGMERIDKRADTAADREQVARAERLANFLDTKEYGYQGSDGWVKPMTHLNQVVDATAADFTSPEALKRLEKFKDDVGKQWDKQLYGTQEGTIGQGNATKRFRFAINPQGEEIPGARLEVTNHAPQSDAGSKEENRQRKKDFQNDLTYKRSLERAVATGGKGMIMIDGVPTSFDGSAESLATLKGMLSDQDTTMRGLYPEEMKARNPKRTTSALEGDASKSMALPAKGVTPLNGGYKVKQKDGSYKYFKGSFPTQ